MFTDDHHEWHNDKQSAAMPASITADNELQHMLFRLQNMLDASDIAAYLCNGRVSARSLSRIGPAAAGGHLQPCVETVAALDRNGCSTDDNGIRVLRQPVPGNTPAVAIAVEVMPGTSVIILAVRQRGTALDFTTQDEQAARRASEWVAGYLRLWWQLRRNQERSDALREALELLGIGVLIIGGGGDLLAVNRAAQTMLDDNDGLVANEGRLCAVSLVDAVRLQAAIAHARGNYCARDRDGNQNAPLMRIGRKGRRPLLVAVMRGAACLSGTHSVVVHAVDPESDLDDALAPVCEMFGLTGAEARLTRLLVSGMSLADAAARLRIQSPTARSYLKQAFVKTGTHRQSSLVQMLLTSVVRAGPGVALTALR